MMKWKITYFDEALQEEIMELPLGLQARYIHLTERMEIYGSNFGYAAYKGYKRRLI